MAKSGFRVMDSDMHVIEPGDLWQQYIEPAFKHRAPKGLSRFLGDMEVVLEGRPMSGEPDKWYVDRLAGVESYREPSENGWSSAFQVQAMDREGIDVAVLYPSRGLYALALDGLDPALGAAIARAYSDWMHDFCAIDPKRMWGTAMVSPFDMEAAVAEVQRSVAELGHKAMFLRPNVVNDRNWHDPYYDPLWAKIEELGVPLGFHEGANANYLPQVGKRFETSLMHHTCCHPMEMMLAVVSFIGGGILERFPSLQVGFLEGNCAWVPWLVWRLDEHYELSGRYESPGLKLKPREYFLRQCYVSIDADEEPALFLEHSSLIDSVVFSTDYPHFDARYPHAIETFLKLPLKKSSKRKILWDNCARLYGFN